MPARGRPVPVRKGEGLAAGGSIAELALGCDRRALRMPDLITTQLHGCYNYTPPSVLPSFDAVPAGEWLPFDIR